MHISKMTAILSNTKTVVLIGRQKTPSMSIEDDEQLVN